MKFFIITGMSGAGKTTVLRHLEDQEYQCMDNLPPALVAQVFSLCDKAEMSGSVALGVDSRSGALFDAETVNRAIEEGRASHDITLLFIDSDTDSLIMRYKETRRDHPLMKGRMTLEESIAKERALIQPLRESANYVISTSGMSPRQLCARIDELISGEALHSIRTEIMSFGYKRGIPRESDLVIDVRFLPNPFYIKEIRAYTGLEEPIRNYVLSQPETTEFLQHFFSFVDFLLPQYEKEGKRRLMISIGCTGGAHRSVAISEALYSHLRSLGHPVTVTHRDLALEESSWTFRRAPHQNF